MKQNKWVLLAGYLVAVFAVAGVTGGLTAPAIPTWYAGLAKPGFNPPNWVFGPVWTLLYLMMAVAAWRVHIRTAAGQIAAAVSGGVSRSTALAAWWVQLALNAAWSVLFFRFHQIGGALVDIVLLLVAIAVTISLFWRINRTAAWLLVPYVAWVGYATALNYEIWRLN
jgi:tryptophan-rich sensory protein